MPEPARPDRAMALLVMKIAAGAALAAFAVVLVRSYRQSPDLGGLLSGAGTGLFCGLLVLGGGAWIAIKLVVGKPAAVVVDPAIEDLLAPVLQQLEAIRHETLTQITARALLRVPLGSAAGLILWILAKQTDDPPGASDLVIYIVAGAGLGAFWAFHAPGEVYRKLYKAKVLPPLAAQFGALTYVPAGPVDAGRLERFGLFARFEEVKAEDEITGTYRDRPLRIVALSLSSGAGEDRRFVFDGLLIELVLPRNLTGTTVMAVDRGLPEAARGVMLAADPDARLARVRLEDPEFERQYQVYGSDQIEARALLTPAFMVRFLDLAKPFGLPRAFAEGNRFTVLLPKSTPKDLFKPPSFMKPAADRVALAELARDIQAVLRMADAVIGLDSGVRSSEGTRPVPVSAPAPRDQ